MASTTRPARFHATVIRDDRLDGYIVAFNYDLASGKVAHRESSLIPTRDEALTYRDELRRMAAARGIFVHASACCA